MRLHIAPSLARSQLIPKRLRDDTVAQRKQMPTTLDFFL